MEKMVMTGFKNIYKGKKVLVTGHTGFKGSWLSIWLNELGAEVYGFALVPSLGTDNFITSGLERKINHRIGDVRDLRSLKDYFFEVQPDIAFHLAAQPLVIYSYENPVETFETNLMGVVNFFEAVRATPSVKAAINVTSDKCYENSEWVWGYRESDPMGGKDPYSASKGCAELITNSYLRSFFIQSDCSVASARAGNVIGGGDWAENRIIPDFFKSVNAAGVLKLRNPSATRPWQFVLEPLSGYLTLGEKLLSDGKTYSGGWNFGPLDVSNYPVQELIEKVKQYNQLGDYELEIENIVQRPEAGLLKLDISKAVNKLKWYPALSIDETVQFTVDGYRCSENDTYLHRVRQILDYTNIARHKHIDWSL